MKILITSSSDQNTLAACYHKHLQEHREVQVIPVYTFDLEEGPASRQFRSRVIARWFPFHITRRSTNLLLKEVARVKPDVVIIVKGTFISAKAIQDLARSGIKMINYNPDHPIHFDTPAAGNENIRKSLRYYHLVYTYSPEIQKDILHVHPSLNVKVLPFGFEPSVYNSNSLQHVQRINRVCFAGTADSERCSSLKAILEAGFPVDAYGSRYEQIKSRNHVNLNIFPSVSGNTYYQTLQAYDVQLNLFRRQNRNSHNMRTFEIPAVGGIQVSPHSDQCTDFFIPDREIFMYRDQQALFTTLEHLLDQPLEQSIEYRHAAREKCVTSDYSYAHRASQMLNDIVAL